jgi:hypothetical protein
MTPFENDYYLVRCNGAREMTQALDTASVGLRRWVPDGEFIIRKVPRRWIPDTPFNIVGTQTGRVSGQENPC